MAGDNFTRSEFDLSPWRGIDPLTIFQAAWLWAGIPPTLPATVENKALYAKALAVASGWRDRLEKAAKAGKLPILGGAPTKEVLIERGVQGSQYLGISPRPAVYQTVANDDWQGVLVALGDLRAYAESIGERPAFFFPGAVDISAPRCLEEGPHFSGELAAALRAWQYASELADGSKKKPRALIVEWLKTNRPQYGEGGKAFERIATLANWEKTTGPKRMK